MADCIFCKIIEGKIPSSKVYEDKDTFAFLDINPVNKGHALVVAKKHTADLLDTDSVMLGKLMVTTQKVAHAVIKGVGADGFNIGINNKSAAGQLVFHLHVHIIPRFSGDGLKHWPGKKLTEQEMRDVQEKIKGQF
ncbi:HIT family protein [Candidatus Woesearchaeota archaeon]|nr:HIT family protein [Candidatus Woesearchaeota archaeon]